jgi:hypothetical protein
MRMIELTAVVENDGTTTLKLPPDIIPGTHHIVVVIDEQPVATRQKAPLEFSAYPVGLVSE